MDINFPVKTITKTSHLVRYVWPLTSDPQGYKMDDLLTSYISQMLTTMTKQRTSRGSSKWADGWRLIDYGRSIKSWSRSHRVVLKSVHWWITEPFHFIRLFCFSPVLKLTYCLWLTFLTPLAIWIHVGIKLILSLEGSRSSAGGHGLPSQPSLISTRHISEKQHFVCFDVVRDRESAYPVSLTSICGLFLKSEGSQVNKMARRGHSRSGKDPLTSE